MAMGVAVEIDEADKGRFAKLSSLPLGNFAQGGIDVRQMVGGDVAHEGAGDFVVAHTTVQPAQEEDELDGNGDERG